MPPEVGGGIRTVPATARVEPRRAAKAACSKRANYTDSASGYLGERRWWRRWRQQPAAKRTLCRHPPAATCGMYRCASSANSGSSIRVHRWRSGTPPAVRRVCRRCAASGTPLSTAPYRTAGKWTPSWATPLQQQNQARSGLVRAACCHQQTRFTAPYFLRNTTLIITSTYVITLDFKTPSVIFLYFKILIKKKSKNI